MNVQNMMNYLNKTHVIKLGVQTGMDTLISKNHDTRFTSKILDGIEAGIGTVISQDYDKPSQQEAQKG